MNEQKQDDQLEPIYNSSVLIQDIALRPTGSDGRLRRVARERERESGRSMLAVRHDMT